MSKQIIRTSGNTGVAKEMATSVARYVLSELKRHNNTSSGHVYVKDDENTFDPESPIGRFTLNVEAEVKVTSKWLGQVLSKLVPAYDWQVEPKGKGFLITSLPMDWCYEDWLKTQFPVPNTYVEHLEQLSTEGLLEEIVWRVGS